MDKSTSLANHLLIATPSLNDPGFKRSVIYICEHHAQGTIGLIINRPMSFPLSLVFEQLNIKPIRPAQNKKPLLFGGPLQPDRGFVIHRPIGSWRSSLALQDEVTVTTSNDIIRAIAKDHGPEDALITLGYVGWGENQLEEEILDDSWLIVPFNSELLYEVPFEKRWEYAGITIGVDMNQLTTGFGHA